MWMIALVGGLTVLAVLTVALPLIILRGIADFAVLLSRAEVPDEQD